MNIRQTRNFLARVPFNTLLGMRLRRVHRDGITLDCALRDDLRNSVGVAHGGVTAAMADAAVGIALQRHFGGKRRIATVELKINYFQPVKEGRILARSHLLRIGSTLCVGSVDLTDDRRRAIGTAIVTYMLIDGSVAVPDARRVRRPSRRGVTEG